MDGECTKDRQREKIKPIGIGNRMWSEEIDGKQQKLHTNTYTTTVAERLNERKKIHGKRRKRRSIHGSGTSTKHKNRNFKNE